MVKKCLALGAVTLIQRFGSALNLNIHFHILFLDGVYKINHEPMAFRRLKSPTTEELSQLIHTIYGRIGRYLEKAGLLNQRFMEPGMRNNESLLSWQGYGRYFQAN